MPQFWRISLTLFCLIVLGLLLWRSPPKELQELIKASDTGQNYPDSYLTGAEITQFNMAGQLNYRLQSESIVYVQNPKSSGPEATIQKPVITVYETEQNQPEWVISSQLAEGSEKKDKLHLKGDVLIRQVLAETTRVRI